MHVVDVVAQQKRTLHADTEREAGIDLRVKARGLEHVRVDHAATAPFEPAGAALLVREPQVELGARLREREIARTQTGLGFRAEHGNSQLVQHTLEIRHGQMLVYCERLALVEHRRMRGVKLVRAEHAAGRRDVQRNPAGEQGAHLIGRSLRAQHHVGPHEPRGILGLIALDIEGVLHLAGGMVGAEVQGVEVVPLGFHFRACGNLPTHGNEEVLDIFHKPGQRMTCA